MSSASPEKERRKLKQPLNVQTAIPNRNKPLFSNIASRQRKNEHQQLDAFPETFNTSYVPTPSPPKSAPMRQSSGAKARLSVGSANGRTLGTALRATLDKTEGVKSPSTARNRTPVPQRRPPTREAHRSSVKKPAPDRAKTRTPSPRRGRPESFVSPSSSASSPPQGLAESYQRIEDEESLAGQEGDMADDMSFENGVLSEDQSLDVDQLRVQRTRGPTFPISQKSSRIPSPTRAQGNPREELNADRNGYAQSLDEGSTSSFPQSVVSDDTFDKVLTQHARDERRVKNALENDSQPFKKARTGIRAGLTLENLQRKDANSQSSGSTLGSPALSSKGSDPSLNIPRDWGRKGRGDNRWLSRIDRNGGKFTGDISKPRRLQDVSVSGSDRRRSSEPIVDWMTEASDIPLPSIEGGSSQTDLRPPSPSKSTPTPAIRRQTSLSQIQEWETNEDNSDAHLLQGLESFPTRTKHHLSGQKREKEIESLEKSAVTTNRLDELREKRSLEQVRRRSPSIPDTYTRDERYSQSPEKSRPKRPPSINEEPSDRNDENISRIRSRQTLSRSPEKPSRLQNSVTSTDELSSSQRASSSWEPPVFVLHPRDAETQSSSNGAKQETAFNTHSSQRPSHERQDSRDLLRRLARVTSASPSPHGHGKRSHTPTVAMSAFSDKAESVAAIPKLGSIEPEKEHLQKPLTTEAQDQDIVINGKQGSKDDDESKSTPQNPKTNTYSKTPLVTGAWIDTPLPIGGRGGLPAPTPTDVTDEKDFAHGIDATLVNLGVQDIPKRLESRPAQELPSLASTAPVLPKSALSNILEQAKLNAKNRSAHTTSFSSSYKKNAEDELNIDDTLQLNESTIQSLEGLVTQDTDIAALLTPPHSSSPPSPTHERTLPSRPNRDDTPMSKDEEELQPYERLASRLPKLALSIRDAKDGIVKLERFVSSAPSSTEPTSKTKTALASTTQTERSKALLSTSSSSPTSQTECNLAGEFHDFIWPCAKCGSNVSGVPSMFAGDTGRVLGAEWQWQTVRLPVPKLWTWRRGKQWPRITGLGWFVLVGWTLMFAERWVRCVHFDSLIPNLILHAGFATTTVHLINT